MRALVVLALALFVASPVLGAEDHEKPAHGAAEHADHADHAEGEHADHGAHHVPTFHDINWFHGMLGEREGVEPNVLYRPKGMPAPFGAVLLNAALLYGVLYRFAKKPVRDALKARKERIMRGMTEAARMKDDAESRLAEYEEKLEHLDQEVERVTKEMRESAESERKAVLAEARTQRERMERDARLLVEQELLAAQDTMRRELVRQALGSAAETLQKRLGADDQQRIAEEYLTSVHGASGSIRVRA